MSLAIHPFINGNPVAKWQPADGSTAGHALGWTFTSGGTVSHPAIAATNLQTQLRRTRFASAASTSSSAGPRSAIAVCWRGTAERLGGFHFSARFTQATNVNGGRAFVGLSASSSSMVTSNPSAGTNLVGVGYDAGDSSGGSFYLMVNDGSGAATKTALAIAPRNTSDVYDLSIYAAPNDSSIVVRLENLGTKQQVTTTLTTDLPTSSSLLYAHAEIGSGTTSTAAQLEIASMALETQEGSFTQRVLGKDGIFDVTDFGALADGAILVACTVDATLNRLTCTSASPFTSADVGKAIAIPGAGTNGTLLRTTIASIVSSDTVTLSPAAGEDVITPVDVPYGTNNLPAFHACQRALTESFSAAEQHNGKFFIPPTEGYYFLPNDFDVLTSATYEGVGNGSGKGGSRLLLAPNCGIRIRGSGAIQRALGDAAGCVVQGLDIFCMHDQYRRWAPSLAVEIGQTFRVRSRRGLDDRDPGGNGEWIAYYECIKAGTTSGGAEPDFWGGQCISPDISTPWSASTEVPYGALMRSSDLSHWDVFFIQTQGQSPPVLVRTGTTEPAWDYTVGNTTVDNAGGGTAEWLAVASTPGHMIQDGTAVFACKTAAAIFAGTPCTIARNYVHGCLGPAIHLEGGGVAPSGNVNHSIIANNQVQCVAFDDPDGNPWSGVGYAISGNDASACSFRENAVFGTNSSTSAQNWQASRPYVVGDRVRAPYANDVDPRKTIVNFLCTQSGTSGIVEPFGPDSFALGTPITGDGGVSWEAVPCPPEYGFYDRGSNGANSYFACIAEALSGPGYALVASGGSGGTYGCYTENSATDIYNGGSAIYGGMGGGLQGPLVERGTSLFNGQAMFVSSVSHTETDPSRRALTRLATPAGTGPSSLQWTLDDDTGGQVLSLDALDYGWWTKIANGVTRYSSWGWTSAQAELAGVQVGPNLFHLTRAFMFGNQLVAGTDPPFIWFASPEISRDFSILGCYRRTGDRRSKTSSNAAPGAYLDEVVTASGYEAPPWQPSQTWFEGIPLGEPTALPAHVVTPPLSALNGFAYRCKVAGDSDANGTEPTTVTTRWTASTVTGVNALVVPTHAAWTGFFYKATVAGTTAASEPATWPTTIGNTVTDGTVTWRCEGHAWGLESGEDTPDGTGTLVWTFAGPAAVWSNTNPVLAASLTKSSNYTLVADDRYVTFTSGGTTASLPAAPTDGELHTVKSGGAFTTTLSGNGKNIDGAASYTQGANREATTVRFNAITNEWERV